MKTLSVYLEQLGFSPNEAKLYLRLFSSGAMTVAELSQATNINRTAAYNYINTLLDKGVITKVKGSTNKIEVNSPESLHTLVQQKAVQIDNLQDKLPYIISTLDLQFKQRKVVEDSNIKYYTNKKSVQAIYNDCLKSNEICAYYDPESLHQIFPLNEKKFNDAITNNPKLIVKELVLRSPSSLQVIKASASIERHLYKFLPKDIQLTANDILIYEGKVAIINIRNESTVRGVVLHDIDYYKNSKQIFNLLWRILPEQKV